MQTLIESEIEVLDLLNHKNIIKFYNSTKLNDIYRLTLEYCENGDVYNYKGKINNSQKCEFLICFQYFRSWSNT